VSPQRYKGRAHSKNRGMDAAIQHIEEAKALSRELGGTDQDVKKWFFSLRQSDLNKILKQYESAYGSKPAEYARETMPDWRSGKRKMSGLVAERLYKLLPPFMPIETKFSLVESLWHHVGPVKKRLIKAGVETSQADVLNAVTAEVRALTTDWVFPEQMQNRFKWLSADDASTYQKLLAHIKEQERALGESVLQDQIPILKAKFENDLRETTSRISYIIEVGKQSVELRMTSDIETLSVGDWHPEYASKSHSTSTDGIPWWIWIAGILTLFIVLGA
jgi:hypothetical protein